MNQNRYREIEENFFGNYEIKKTDKAEEFYRGFNEMGWKIELDEIEEFLQIYTNKE